jgi:hypothetical protein
MRIGQNELIPSVNLSDFSVVIPIGNYEKDSLNIKSIVEQNELFSVQTILVLDHQDLEHAYELDLFIRKNGFINTKAVAGSWENPGGARNFGLSLCTRTWVSFWDSDDLQYVQNIVEIIRHLESCNCDAVMGVFEIEINDTRSQEAIPLNKKVINSLDSRILANPGLWRFVFRRSSILDLKFAELSAAEDQIFLMRFLQCNPKVCPIDKIVYVYVKGSNAQLTNSPLVYKQTLSALDLITDELMEWEDQWKPLGQSLILKLAISAFRNGDMIRKILALKVLVSLLKNFGPSNFLKASFRNCHSFYSHPVKVDVKR